MLELNPLAVWTAFRRESLPFLCLCSYIFIEYVRPQRIYRGIDVIPFGEVTLGLTVAAYVFAGMQTRKLTMLDGLLVLFTLIVLASSVAAYSPAASWAGMLVYINWLVLFYLVTHIVNTPRRFFLFLGLFFLWSLKMSQHGARTWVLRGFRFASWGATGGPGWFANSGEFAIQMCIFAPMAFYAVLAVRGHTARWKFWGLMALLPGTAFMSLMASSSRGGQLGMLAVIFFVIAQSKYRVKGLIYAFVLLAGLWAVMPPEQKVRFEEMGSDENSVARLTLWKDGITIANQYPVLGIGYDNWTPYYHRYYNPAGQVQHNIFVEAGSELGYVGLSGFVLLILGTFSINRRTRRMASRVPVWGDFLRTSALGLDAALVGFMVSGFFVTVLYYPFFWMNLAFTGALFETTRRAGKKVARHPARRFRNGGGTASHQPGPPATALTSG